MRLSFDNFNNPPVNALVLIPINLRMNYIDCSADFVTSYGSRTSYFPNIYYSDSRNVAAPAAMGSNHGNTITRSHNTRGTQTLHYWNFQSWPFNSNSG